MTRPFQGSSDRITLPGDKDTEGSCASPREQEKLVPTNDHDEWLNRRWVVRLLVNRKHGEHLSSLQVDDVVILAVGDTEVLARTSR